MKKMLVAMVAASLLCACKPSEKNYRLAYETAVAREHEGLDEGIYELMQEAALPPMVRIAGDSVRVERKPLVWFYTPSAVDSGKPASAAPYNLAVSRYKMATNARAHADALAGEGYGSYVFRSGRDLYYVMAALLPTLDSAAHASSQFLLTHKDGYVGIPCPIAIQPQH